MSYATLKDNARIVADGEGLTPTITFLVASDQAIATKRAAVQDLVQRLNKARLWSLDHLREYAKSTAELTKLPEDVLLSAYTAQRTSPIVIDEALSRRFRKPPTVPPGMASFPRRSMSARPWIAALPPRQPAPTNATFRDQTKTRAGVRRRPFLLRFSSCETPACAVQCSRAAPHRAVWSDR